MGRLYFILHPVKIFIYFCGIRIISLFMWVGMESVRFKGEDKKYDLRSCVERNLSGSLYIICLNGDSPPQLR